MPSRRREQLVRSARERLSIARTTAANASAAGARNLGCESVAVWFVQQGKSDTAKDSAKIAGAVVVGALGAGAGGLCHRNDLAPRNRVGFVPSPGSASCIRWLPHPGR